MKLTIEDIRGVWKAELNGRSEFGDTLEDVLYSLAPEASPEYIWHTAEVLGGILGAQTVEQSWSPEAAEVMIEALAGLLQPGTDEMADELMADIEASQAREVPAEESADDGA